MEKGNGNGIDQEEAKAALRTILLYLGEDPDREGLLETPDRIVRSYEELFCGYKQDPKDILQKSFGIENYDQMVIIKSVPFVSFCEHHFLPFTGKCSIAYIPKGQRVVGLSKLARLVDIFAKRLQIQERMTLQIADALEQHIAPAGIAVVVEAVHQCMACRGVKKKGASMITSDMRGAFRSNESARAEFLNLVRD